MQREPQQARTPADQIVPSPVPCRSAGASGVRRPDSSGHLDHELFREGSVSSSSRRRRSTGRADREQGAHSALRCQAGGAPALIFTRRNDRPDRAAPVPLRADPQVTVGVFGERGDPGIPTAHRIVGTVEAFRRIAAVALQATPIVPITGSPRGPAVPVAVFWIRPSRCRSSGRSSHAARPRRWRAATGPEGASASQRRSRNGRPGGGVPLMRAESSDR